MQLPSKRIPDLSFLDDLMRFATRPMTAQRDEMASGIWQNYCQPKYISVPIGNGNRSCYVHRPVAERGFSKIVDEEFSSRDKWETHLSAYHSFRERGDRLVEQARQADRKSLAECLDVYEKWLAMVSDFGKIILAPFALEHRLDPECRELLAKEFGGKADHILGIISTPDRINDFQKMRLDILSSALRGQPTAAALAEEYFWYSEYSFVEPLLDQEYFEQEIQKVSLVDAEREQQKILDDIGNNKAAFLATREKIDNKRLLLLVDILHEYVFLRTDRIDVWKRVQAQMRKVFFRIYKEIAQKDNQPWQPEMIPCFLNREIIEFLSAGAVPAYEEIKERADQNYVFYIINGRCGVVYGREAERIMRTVLEADRKKAEIKGTIVYNGKVAGKVVVVTGKKDFAKIKEGDILVAKTTMPDYMAPMQRAAAIVTEEGGITSHAAIVARELKKPCIVGTGNCMALLKDGDLVEVDADRGVVRKIDEER